MDDLGSQRHRARERALEILYEAAMKGRSIVEILPRLTLAPDPYTVRLVESVEANEARALQLIGDNLVDWTIERLAMVDRLVMILAIAELLLADPPPTAVVLNEAVELARTFSTEDSPSFVNGVLAACVDDLG